MDRRKGHDGNGDGRAVHVDCRAEGDGDGIHVLVQSQLFAQRHIHRDVGGGTPGEKRRQAALTQTAEQERIGIAAQGDGHHNRIDHQGGEEHTAHQRQHQLPIRRENLNAVRGDGREHQAHDAEGGQVDNPAHRLGDGVGHIGEHSLGTVRRDGFQGNAEDHRPEENAEIAPVNDGG